VNGHGSNVPFLGVAARNVTNQTESIRATAPWWNLAPKTLLRELREIERPGGMARGCQMETSVLLYLRGDLVQMDKADQRSVFSGMVQPLFKDRHGGRPDAGHPEQRAAIY
jgi:creatinine amidohydrolase/Fe(II)-dependent formamide hydrolase-like protein